MKAEGKHIIAELHGCNANLLNDEQKLKETIIKIGNKYKLDIRDLISKFEPYGITCIAIIGQSHIAFHTYPEDKHLSLDIFTCSGAPMPIYEAIKNIFKPTNSTFYELHRGRTINIHTSDWIKEDEQPVEGYRDEYHIKSIIHQEKTPYQEILIIENEKFGKMLFLDKELQISEIGQYKYDNAFVSCIPRKHKERIENILIIGGGDGGVGNQLLKTFPNIKHIDMIEIDGRVIELCKKYFSGICGGVFSDDKVSVIITDAFNFIKETNKKYNAIFIDLTDVVNRQMNIELNNIMDSVNKILLNNGYLVVQASSAYDETTQEILKNAMINKFRNCKRSDVWLPAYGSVWSFLYSVK